MNINKQAVRTVANTLYIVAIVVYLASLLTRTLLIHWAYHPDLARFSRPLADVLPFFVMELQGLTPPCVATICLISAFVLRPMLTSFLDKHETLGSAAENIPE